MIEPVRPGGEAGPRERRRPQPPPVLEVHDLEVAYGDRTAVAGVDLAFAKGSITAIMGPSGCGKSSLLLALNRLTDLLPSCRVSGRVTFHERDVFDPGTDVVELRRRIGTIFQRPNPFPLSIRRNLELALVEHRRLERGAREAVVEGSLRAVGLWDEVKDRLDRSALALSGGQQQRLCFARALALEPEVLLLDEPCSALDPLASGVVEDLIVSLRDRYTIVVVTHNLAQARRIADDVAFFWARDNIGVLVEKGRREQVFGQPRHELTAAYVAGVRG